MSKKFIPVGSQLTVPTEDGEIAKIAISADGSKLAYTNPSFDGFSFGVDRGRITYLARDISGWVITGNSYGGSPGAADGLLLGEMLEFSDDFAIKATSRRTLDDLSKKEFFYSSPLAALAGTPNNYYERLIVSPFLGAGPLGGDYFDPVDFRLSSTGDRFVVRYYYSNYRIRIHTKNDLGDGFGKLLGDFQNIQNQNFSLSGDGNALFAGTELKEWDGTSWVTTATFPDAVSSEINDDGSRLIINYATSLKLFAKSAGNWTQHSADFAPSDHFGFWQSDFFVNYTAYDWTTASPLFEIPPPAKRTSGPATALSSNGIAVASAGDYALQTYELKDVPQTAAGQSFTGKVGEAFSSGPIALADAITATSWAAAALPAGLTINTTTGEITGTPTALGTFSVTLTPSNDFTGIGAAVEITIAEGAPIITAGQTASGKVGTAFSFTPALTDSANRPVTNWSATGLPSWAVINTTTGAITGSPTTTESATITLTAAGPGGEDSETVTISSTAGTPLFAYPLLTTLERGEQTSISPSITDSANRPITSWSATGLPAGLTINTSTGEITGAPTTADSFTATITATGPGGSSTKSASFEVTNTFPIFRGGIRAAAIYAGATEGKALYYGPQLLWNVPGWEPPAFSPASIAGLRLWLDASVGLYDAATGGNPVTTAAPVLRWEDQSGNGFHATAVSSTAPSLALSQVNSLPGILFPSTGGKYFNLPNPLPAGGTGATIFVVTQPTQTGSDGGPLVGMIGSNTEFWSDSHYPYRNSNIEDGFAATTRKTITPLPSGMFTWHLYNVVSGAGDWRYLFNGSVYFSTTTNTYNGASFSGRTPKIGYSDSRGTWYFRGTIAEIVIYNSALSETDRQTVTEYLREKYNLW